MTLKRHKSFQNENNRKATHNFAPRRLTFNLLDTEMGVEGGMDLSQYVSVVFSYLLNFCKLWHLCKFRILGELFTNLFGLVFPCPTSDKMSGLPLRSIKVVFFKFFFFKKIVKNVAQALFIYVCVYKPPQAPFRQLGPSFLG